MNFTIDKPAPEATEAERAVLGAIIINNRAYYRVPNLSAPDFGEERNRLIFEAIALLAEEGLAIDPISIKLTMARNGHDVSGISSYLSSLTESIPDIARIEIYADMVSRAAKKRAQVKAGIDVVMSAFDLAEEPEETAAKGIAALGNATRADVQARPLVEVLSDVYEAQQALRAADKSMALTSGFATLDEHRVFTPTLWVWGSPTGHGKSVSMVSLSDGLARHGHPNGMFSLESTTHEIGLRYTSKVTGIPHSRMRDWRSLSDADFVKVGNCHTMSSKLPIYLTRRLRAVEDIVLEIRRLKAVHGIEAVFIDYIQLVETRRKVDSREERLAEISKMLLDVAIDAKVHVSAFSQLRDGAGKDGARLTVDDLAYAKAIGKSARGVVLFQRPRKLDPTSDIPTCRVDGQIEKNNEDRTNDFLAHLDETTQRFTEGTCEQNDCRRLRASGPIERSLF